MKLYPDTKVYVLCPANLHTGGPESLHQLASRLISFGVDAEILFGALFNQFFDVSDPVPTALKKYHVPYTFNFEDNARNIFIVPESLSEHLYAVKDCRRILWWMSVDNYLKNIFELIRPCIDSPLTERVPKFFTFDNSGDVTEHWAKCEFVRQFLEFNGIPAKKTRHVETYMNQTFFEQASQIELSAKKNFVAFNPRKGYEITQRLMKLAPEIDWRPIQDMTPAQVQKLLAEAKIYIDFGEHPGRDRLPREATISRCVVITGRRGAANNDLDINIPAEFKFDEHNTKPQTVIDKIREVFENFEPSLAAQEEFRQRVYDDKKNFSDAIISAFELKKFPPPSVALTQGVDEKSFLLAEELFKGNELLPKFIVDDVLAAANISDDLIVREQNRNYLRVGKNLVELITLADAKFLYQEERIKKFALLDPIDEDFSVLKDFAAPDDVLSFAR